jgi:hypothetical protein
VGKSKYVFGFLVFSVVSLFAQANRYDIKSAIVEYEISGNGDVMGNEASVSGTSKLYFKDYGQLELSEEKIGQTITDDKEEEHNITKIVGNKVYSVDFDEQVIYQDEMVLDEESPYSLKNSETLISMGAKKIGSEEILGYKCDIWQLGEDKIWIYNTIPLKFVSKSFGIVQIQQAKLAVFNIDIKDDKFKLPPFPIKIIDDTLNNSADVPELSPEQEKMVEDLMKQTGKTYTK